MRLRPPFKFAEEQISHDTVQALRELLGKAEKGEVIGVAYSVMNRKRSYNVCTAGELHRNPTYAMGTVLVLLYRLLMRAVGEE